MNKKIITGSLLLMGISLLSCNKALEKANENKNNPSDIPLPGLLPSAEVALAYNIAGDFSIRSSVFMQQIAGIGGFAVNDDRYSFSTTNFNSAWGNAYKVLNNLSIMISKAKVSNAPVYTGVARVLTAVSLGTLTDAYGDIPYAEALNAENLAPHYQSQEVIYDSIQVLLDSAISNLQQTGTIAPGTDDVIFKGNVAKWIAAAWTLKARYALHLSKLNAQDAAQKALSYLYDDNNVYRGIQNNDGDIAVVFGTASNQASPWFTQDAGRPGWYGMGAYLINLLNGIAPDVPVDPRRAAFAAPRPSPAAPNTYIGALPGVPSAASNIVGPNTYYGIAAAPVSILNFPESKFIEAEARLLLNPDDNTIQPAFEAAVRASLTKVTAANDTFASNEKKEAYISKAAYLSGDVSTRLAQLITQKYIALYLNPEAWTDYRRTGFPALMPAEGGSNAINPTGQIPRRFAYPNSETTLNPNTPASSDLQTPRLWWDK